jgi:hypothetical protein
MQGKKPDGEMSNRCVQGFVCFSPFSRNCSFQSHLNSFVRRRRAVINVMLLSIEPGDSMRGDLINALKDRFVLRSTFVA